MFELLVFFCTLYTILFCQKCSVVQCKRQLELRLIVMFCRIYLHCVLAFHHHSMFSVKQMGEWNIQKTPTRIVNATAKTFVYSRTHTHAHTPADTDRDGYEERQRNPWAERKAVCVCAKIYSYTTTIIKLYNFIIHFQFALLSSHLYKCNLPLHSIISWISFKFESSINFP